jgi:predicted O-methyltransferase YrrM
MPESLTSFEGIFQQLSIPQGARYVSISEVEGKFIHNWIGEHQLSATLEIGLAYGASAVSIMSAHGGMHTCVDPFQEQSYQNIGLKNLEAFGYQDRLIYYQDFSHNILPRLHAEGRKYDFIFIDGSHHFDNMFVDFYFANLLLSQNGYILFHDSWMRSTQLVVSYIRHNRSNYAQNSGAGLNLIMFQKSSIRHKLAWDDFNEFYTLRGMLSHSIIRRILRFFKR